MATWKELQTTLIPVEEHSALLLLFLIILLSLTFILGNQNLPGPSFLQNFPNGEVYPILRNSRTTLRTLMKLNRKYGEVFQTWIGPSWFVVSANPGDIAQILASADEFVRPDGMVVMLDAVVPGGLLTMPKGIHTASRRRLKANFNFSMLQCCHSYLTDAVKELCEELNTLARGGCKSIDISPVLAKATFRVITSIAFGCDISRGERAQVLASVDQLIDEMLKDVLGYPLRQALTPFGVRKGLFEAHSNIKSICQDFIKRRVEETPAERAARPRDALDAILTLNTDITAVTSQTVELAVAGSHTVYQALSWCIFEICRKPNVESEVIKELDECLSSKTLTDPLLPDDIRGLKYLQKVWKESNRMHPPGGFVIRKASYDTTLRGSGSKLRKGTQVLGLIQAVQNRHDLWRDAETFDPERWGDDVERGEGDRVPVGAYVPFSLGERNCIGRFLADHEGVLILAELYRRFRFRLACHPDEVVSCTGWVESPKSASVEGGDLDRGVPVEVMFRT